MRRIVFSSAPASQRANEGDPPEVVAAAQDQVRLLVECGPDLSEPAVAGAALEAVLVPELVDGLEQVSVCDGGAAAGAQVGGRGPPAAAAAAPAHARRHLRLLSVWKGTKGHGQNSRVAAEGADTSHHQGAVT